MQSKPTLSTVAREAGVSVPTVSQVMRGTGRISDQTRDRVLAAVERLNYVPDQRAAAMRSGENREIGLVINQLGNPFNAEVIGGAVDVLEAQGFLVSVVDTRDDPERQARQLDTFIRHGRGGLLWVPALDTPVETFALLKKRRLPTVTFLRRGDPELDHVGIRDAEATARATGHLASLGHKRIAYLGGTGTAIVRRERIAGYRAGLAAHGLGDAVVWPCADNKLAGLEATLALCRAHPDVTGLVCNGDMVALGACLAVIRQGLVPGRDLSIVGFDDIQDAAVATPPLTTMAVSPRRLGRMLAQTLLDRIQNPTKAATVSEVSAELILRETTGAPVERRPAQGIKD